MRQNDFKFFIFVFDLTKIESIQDILLIFLCWFGISVWYINLQKLMWQVQIKYDIFKISCVLVQFGYV